MSAAVANRLAKQHIMLWPAAASGAQGQGMGASSARSSQVQLEHGITSGATLPLQLSPSLSLPKLPFASHIINVHKSNTHKSYTGKLAHECTCMHL